MSCGERASGNAADQGEVVEQIAIRRLDALERGENAVGKSRGAQPATENDSTIEFSRMKSVGAPMFGGVAADNGWFVAGLNTAVAQPASPPTAATTSIASRIIHKRLSQRARWLTAGVLVDARATAILKLRRCAARPASSSAAPGGGSAEHRETRASSTSGPRGVITA